MNRIRLMKENERDKSLEQCVYVCGKGVDLFCFVFAFAVACLF